MEHSQGAALAAPAASAAEPLTAPHERVPLVDGKGINRRVLRSMLCREGGARLTAAAAHRPATP